MKITVAIFSSLFSYRSMGTTYFYGIFVSKPFLEASPPRIHF